MAHTNSWSDNTPLGSDAADTMDNNMRQVRLDVAERMNDILGSNNWRTQDPVTLPGLLTAFKFAKRYRYDDLQSAGFKAVEPASLRALLIIRYSGTTDIAGNITINFGALFETYDLTSIDLDTFVRGMVVNRTVNDVAFIFIGSVVGDVVTYSVRKSNGNLYISDVLEGDIIFWAAQKPT